VLRDKPVLIVEDNVYLALDLSYAVESLDGIVVGPVGTMKEAFAIVDRQSIAAAVLAFELPDSSTIPLQSPRQEASTVRHSRRHLYSIVAVGASTRHPGADQTHRSS